MNAFFVGTPYQLIVALQLRTQCYADEAADLYLVKTFTDLSGYEQMLRDSGLFANVYRTCEPRALYARNVSQARRFLGFFWPRTRIARLLRGKTYARMFSTFLGFGNTYYFHYLQKNNPGLTFSYFEEGLGFYTLPVFDNPKMMRVLERLGFANVYRRIEAYWLFSQSLLVTPIAFPVREIPRLTADSALTRLFLHGKSPALPAGCRFLYFDTSHSEQLHLTLDYSRLMEALGRCIAMDSFYLKLHPEQTKTNLPAAEGLQVYASDTPWEMEMPALPLTQTVLITLMSNAVVSPKLLCDREPTVIVLYRLFRPHWQPSANVRELYRRVQASYRTPRFLIPETWEELEMALRDLASGASCQPPLPQW